MNERSIFLEALDQADPTQRSDYLDKACAGDAALRQRVEALLKTHSEAGGFLDRLAPDRVAEELGRQQAGEETQGASPGNDKAGQELGFLTPADKPDVLGRLGHYDILEVIGRGGMGIVLRAFDDRLHRVVAIKVMAAQLATIAAARKRFQREAQAAAAVSHDHLVTIHAVEETNGLPYIAMQYVACLSMQQRLERDGPLQLHQILRIGMQTASGLAAAHAQGLIHRDIKPANILLENGVERVKITDFGLARAAADASLTQSGVVAGTPQYMSPEQAEGKAIDHRTDLFSLGSVLYAMCTGRAPFRASGTMAVLKRVCETTPTPIRETNPDIPDWLVAIVDKLHAKDPAQRYQSAAEVAELLGRHLAHLQHPSVLPLLPSPPGRRAGGEGRPSARPRRDRWAVAAAALLLLVGGLSLTEAAGVTHLRATVIRIFTPDGTLVVETTDPGVKVTIEGDGGLIITGAGLEEMRLRPGSYKVHAERDGKSVPLERELVSIAKGSREVVKVKLEARPALAAANVEKGGFVLLAAGEEREFDTLADAVQRASDGDTIEIRGNGPFVSKPVTISNRRALTIRAGAGVRPVLQLGRGTAQDQTCLLNTNGPLVLEGLDIRCERPAGAKSSEGFSAVNAFGGRVHVANCRFVAPLRTSLFIPDCRRAIVTNCEFLGSFMDFSALAGHQAPGSLWKLDNCVQIGGAAVSCGSVSRDVREGTVQLRRCSLVGCMPLFFYFYAIPKDPDSGRAARMVQAEVSGCLLGNEEQLTGAIWHPESLNQSHTPPAVRLEDCFRHMIRWRGSANVFRRAGNSSAGPEAGLIHLVGGQQDERLPGVRDVATWRKFWDSPETGSLTGEVRYEGGDLAARWLKQADRLTPEDFRLRPDSAGYRTGKDGRDLGADVDLVGPGAAYERWKSTPEYQQWLKETGLRK